MLSALKIILANPALRIATLTLFFTGMTGGATLPYLSIVAIDEFKLSDQLLSGLLFLIAFANLICGVTVAVFSDLVADRRPLLIGVFSAGILGFGLIYLLPTMAVFILSAVLLVPLSNSGYSLLFATIRSLSNRLASSEAAAINTVVRATFSGSWMLVPALIGFWLTGAPSMLGAWGFAAMASTTCLGLTLFLLPPIRATPEARSQRLPFFASLRLATTPAMLARVSAMSLITGATRLIAVVQPLIIVGRVHGGLADVGMVAGGCAALEIPFMLVWGTLIRRLGVLPTLALGTGIYMLFMAFLAFATKPLHIYLLLIPNAFGVSAILSLPLSYFQDLLADRPGLGTSLNQMMAFASTGLSALAFALGAHFLGYSLSSLIGVGMALAGIAALLAIEARRPMSSPMASTGRH